MIAVALFALSAQFAGNDELGERLVTVARGMDSGRMVLRVAAIQRFCLQDGPGIRTVVFLQGCPLRCWWCHNAAMQPPGGGVERCTPDLAEELLRDARYWLKSGGGVTLSGGEPLFQAEASAELLAELGARGVHRCVETAASAPSEAVAQLDAVVDLWLLDVKTLDRAAFRDNVKGELEPVVGNLRALLCRRPESVWVRVPLIRGFNDDEAGLGRIRDFLAGEPHPARVQILPGHDLASRPGRSAAVDPDVCRRAAERLAGVGLPVEVCW